MWERSRSGRFCTRDRFDLGCPDHEWRRRVSLAGWWRALVSQPLFLVAETGLAVADTALGPPTVEDCATGLRLVRPHPDLAGGLGFTVARFARSQSSRWHLHCRGWHRRGGVLHRGEPLSHSGFPWPGSSSSSRALCRPLFFLAFPLLTGAATGPASVRRSGDGHGPGVRAPLAPGGEH
jgi:hypothetical protein